MANQANAPQVPENERHALALAHVAVNTRTGAVTVLGSVDEHGEAHDLVAADQIHLQNAMANQQAMYTNQIDAAQFQLLLTQPHFTPLPDATLEAITGKRTIDQAFGSDYVLGVDDALLGQGPNKRRRITNDQELKRYKYDVVRAFFRLYFRSEPGTDAMVLKEAISALYEKKIPHDIRLARNAMFRHMWSWYKNQISVFQSNYRDYIKGLKLIKTPTPYPELEADEQLLRSAGVEELFDWTEDDLAPKADNPLSPEDSHQSILQSNHNNSNILSTDEQLGHLPASTSNNNTAASTRASSPQHKPFSLNIEELNEGTILQHLDQLEAQAKNALAVIGEIRSKITRALQQAPHNQ